MRRKAHELCVGDVLRMQVYGEWWRLVTLPTASASK
jgi:hypothetical protein